MTAPAETVRVFIALDISPAAKDALAQTVQELRQAIPTGVRWVDPRGTHLTLKFLGNVDASLVDDILAAMKSASEAFPGGNFRLTLSGLGVFPNERRPRVLWAGIAGDLEPLNSLYLAVDEAISRLGFSREERPFRPHLTIGRVQDSAPPKVRQSIGEAALQTRLPPVKAWEVDTLHLMRSTLTLNGAVYTKLDSAAL